LIELINLIKQKKKSKKDPPVSRNALSRLKTDSLYGLLEENGPMTRKEIVSTTGMPWSTVYDSLCKLECRGKVSRYSIRAKRGRPKVLWRTSS